MPSRSDPDFEALDAEQAAALFDSSADLPAPPAAPVLPPTPRMREAARRRAREQRARAEAPEPVGSAVDPAATADEPPMRYVTNEDEIHREIVRLPTLIEIQRQAMAETFRQSGLTLASLQLEMLATARAAAAEGEYQAAGGIYKTIAQTLGAVSGDKHVHLHGAPSGGPLTTASLPDLRAAADSALYALIERAKTEQQVIDAPRSVDPVVAPAAELAPTDAHPAQPAIEETRA